MGDKQNLRELKKKLAKLHSRKKKILKKTSQKKPQNPNILVVKRLIEEVEHAIKDKNYTKASILIKKASILSKKLGDKAPHQAKLANLDKKLTKARTSRPKRRTGPGLRHIVQDLQKGSKLLRAGQIIEAEHVYNHVYREYYKAGLPAEAHHEKILDFYKAIMDERYKEKHRFFHR